MAVEPTGFRLRPDEDFLFGVSMRDGVLRFGPAGSAVLYAAVIAAAYTAVGLLALVVAPTVKAGSTGWTGDARLSRVIGGVLIALGLWYLISRLRSGVRASVDGVSVRGLWRSEDFPWSRVTGVRIVNSQPPPTIRWRLAIGALGPGGAPMSIDVESSKAYLSLDDGTEVRLRGFESAVRQSSGLPQSIATPTELKVEALRRYREVEVGPWQGSEALK